MRRSAAMLVLVSAACLADAPLPPPAPRTVCSRSNSVCATSDPALGTHAYAVRPDGTRQELFSLPGWHRILYLADDGHHAVTGYDGVLLPLRYSADTPLITFWRDGAKVRAVALRDLVKDLGKLQRTASHYHWGSYVGFDAAGRFVVNTVERAAVTFDVATGQESAVGRDPAPAPPDPYTPAQFPVTSVFKGKPAPPILKSQTERLFKTKIREGAKTGPNFAGHYTLMSWGCGTSCQQYALVDAVNGKVLEMPFKVVSSQPPYPIPDDVDSSRLPPFDRAESSLSSRLFVVGGCLEEDEKRCGWHYYEMTESGLKPLRTVPFPPAEALPRAAR